MVINIPTKYEFVPGFDGHETDTSSEAGDSYEAGDSHSDSMSTASGYGSSDDQTSTSDKLKLRVDTMSSPRQPPLPPDAEERGLRLGMPFEDAEWMLDMPKSPEQCKNRESGVGWGTPPKAVEAAAGGVIGGAPDVPTAIQATKRKSFDPQAGVALQAAKIALEAQSPVLASRDNAIAEGPKLRFLNFNDFRLNFKDNKPRTEMPRSPEHAHVLVDLTVEKKFDRSTSLVVFISHTHLAGFDGRERDEDGNDSIVSQAHADNWRQSPHPDTKHNDKFDLILRGINLLWQTMAKDMNDCFLWIDYCCLDQDANPAEELQRIGGYEKVMSFCDCVFTPIVDKQYNSWDYKALTNRMPDWLHDYESKKFRGGSRYEAYLERAWCRLELLYAANLPVWTSGDSKYDDARVKRMAGGLYIASRHGRRAHFLYGTKEDLSGFGLIKLPPLPRSFQTEYSPLDGAVTRVEDMQAIRALWSKLVVNDNPVTEYYIGSRNAEGQKDGQGTFTWEDGSKYEGGWSCDEQHGECGVYTWANGEVILGNWEHGHIPGYAKYTNLDGDVYYGEVNVHKQKHGTGQLIYADGDIYEGCFRNGLRHFKGRMRYKDGDEFVGYFKHNKMNGFGSWTYASGGYFYGYFKNDRRNGQGIFSSGEGTEFEGYYDHGKKHGAGKMKYSDGTRLEGTWVNGKMEGEGIYYRPNGDVEKGYWVNAAYVGTEPPTASSSACITPSSKSSRGRGRSSTPSSTSESRTSLVTPSSSAPASPVRPQPVTPAANTRPSCP